MVSWKSMLGQVNKKCVLCNNGIRWEVKIWVKFGPRSCWMPQTHIQVTYGGFLFIILNGNNNYNIYIKAYWLCSNGIIVSIVVKIRGIIWWKTPVSCADQTVASFGKTTRSPKIKKKKNDSNLHIYFSKR